MYVLDVILYVILSKDVEKFSSSNILQSGRIWSASESDIWENCYFCLRLYVVPVYKNATSLQSWNSQYWIRSRNSQKFSVWWDSLHSVRSLSVSFFIEKEPHSQPRMKRKRKGGRRRKRHSTSTCESGQQTSLFTRSYQGLTDSLGQSLARTQPPPPPFSIVHPLMTKNQWFSGKAAKKYDSLFLETQKWCGWIRTAFVTLYKLEWKW